MTATGASASPWRGREIAALGARWILGGIFVYMGLSKALQPVDFLKLVREYQMVESHVVLNLLAAALPWFELLCGTFLVAGIAVRGSALVSLVMLVPFSLIVLQRALAIHEAKAIPFCAIRFDCGCGVGEVVICYKLLENGLLILLAGLLLGVRANHWCLRCAITKSN
ncbi:MAG: DoxX family membrane protein [Acidobacteriales bacterium]|nr:DoxX family membrane protein [Terriglobales bacterium]